MKKSDNEDNFIIPESSAEDSEIELATPPPKKKRGPAPKKKSGGTATQKGSTTTATTARNKSVAAKKPPTGTAVTLPKKNVNFNTSAANQNNNPGAINNRDITSASSSRGGVSSATKDKESASSVSIANKGNPPTASNIQVEQTNALEESDSFKFDDEEVGDANESVGGFQITAILEKLNADLKIRMEAKKKKMKECFLSVNKAPNKILQTLSTQSNERTKVIEGFHKKFQDITEQVNSVFEMQQNMEEKLTMMILTTQKHFDQIKSALNTCMTGMKDTLSQFEKETKDMEGEQNDGFKNELDSIQKELHQLQRRIIMDGQEEEAESIRSNLKYNF